MYRGCDLILLTRQFLQLAIRDAQPFLKLGPCAVLVIDQQPLADFFQREAKATPPQNQGHARHIARAVKPRPPLFDRGQQFNVFVIAQRARRYGELGAHIFEG